MNPILKHRLEPGMRANPEAMLDLFLGPLEVAFTKEESNTFKALDIRQLRESALVIKSVYAQGKEDGRFDIITDAKGDEFQVYKIPSGRDLEWLSQVVLPRYFPHSGVEGLLRLLEQTPVVQEKILQELSEDLSPTPTIPESMFDVAKTCLKLLTEEERSSCLKERVNSVGECHTYFWVAELNRILEGKPGCKDMKVSNTALLASGLFKTTTIPKLFRTLPTGCLITSMPLSQFLV